MTVRLQNSRTEASVRSRLERSRSRRLTTTRRGSPSDSASAHTFSVCTSTPETASTTTSAASATRRPARASDEEVAHARRVDEVDLGLVPLGPGEAGRQGVLAGDFFVVVVGDRRPIVHPPQAGRRTSGEEEGGDQLGLARTAVSDDSDVADTPSVVCLHGGYPPLPGGGPGAVRSARRMRSTQIIGRTSVLPKRSPDTS